MKTITCNWRLGINLLSVLILLCLSFGCTSEAVKEFRKASGRTVVVDKTYEIPRKYIEAKVLEAGVYQLEFQEDSPKYIWFRSSLSDIYTVLMDFTEYKKVADNNVFRTATPADIEKAVREKDERSKIIEAKSVDLRRLILVTGEDYQGDTIMKAIDATDSKAIFQPDQTINFRLDDKYYYIGTKKVTFDYPAVYRITFIQYKGIPWQHK
jgi:hypothetical protein